MGIEVALEGHVAVVRLAWPERRNALGITEATALAEALSNVAEQDTRVLILTGTGAFCAGGNLKELLELVRVSTREQLEQTVYETYQRLARALLAYPIPTIAAVDGPAIGLGMDLALACDMRFVGPDAWMAQGWANVGLLPGLGGLRLLGRGDLSVTWRLIADQPRLGPQELVDLGLAELADGMTAIDAAQRRANALAKLPSETLTAYARLTRPSQEALESTWRMTAALQAGLLSSPAFAQRAERTLRG